MFVYIPNVDYAYRSIMYLRQEVPFGWLIHGLHYWGSNAFIIMVSIHMARVFIWGAYKDPRQLIWLSGAVLFILVLMLSFTGALLPWDELGYWAAEVGTSISGTIPLVGFFIKEFTRGGAAMGQATLSRFFMAHVVFLPALLAILVVFHLIAFRQFQNVGPWNPEKQKKMGRFWPQQVLKDVIVVSIVMVVLVGLTVFWPAPITGPADPIDNSITPKPEWQFLFLYEFLKLFKGPWEPVGTFVVPLLIFLILFLLPFYDRGKKQNPLHRPFVMLGGLALLAWFIVYTILGYISVPGETLMASVGVSATASADVKAGAKFFTTQACISCHTVYGKGGTIGPNLSKEGISGRSRQWLAQQIRDPKSHNPSSVMPAFTSLSDKQVNQLVDFLETLGKGKSSPSKKADLPSKAGPPACEPNTGASGHQPASGRQETLAQKGKEVFNSQSCSTCHTINGKGGSLGPNLSDEAGRARSDQWLAAQIKDPKSHNPKTLMPPFDSLGQEKINELVAYMQSLKTKPTAEKAAAPPPSPAIARKKPGLQGTGYGKAIYFIGNPSHGQLLFCKNCRRCHGPEGKGNISNPGSTTGTVPPLNPVREQLFSKDPLTFAKNIDVYVQNGSIPEGPNPENNMPAFGSNLTLTQEMISEILAYILKINDVNREKIEYPGVKPYTFFIITIILFAISILLILIWRLPKKKNSKTKNNQTPL